MSHDWPLAGSPISTDLEISNKTQSLTVAMIKLALAAKLYVVLLKGMSGREKRLQKFMLRQQVNMNNITTKLTADDHNFSAAPTPLLQANLFLSTFVCLVTKPNT